MTADPDLPGRKWCRACNSDRSVQRHRTRWPVTRELRRETSPCPPSKPAGRSNSSSASRMCGWSSAARIRPVRCRLRASAEASCPLAGFAGLCALGKLLSLRERSRPPRFESVLCFLPGSCRSLSAVRAWISDMPCWHLPGRVAPKPGHAVRSKSGSSNLPLVLLFLHDREMSFRQDRATSCAASTRARPCSRCIFGVSYFDANLLLQLLLT